MILECGTKRHNMIVGYGYAMMLVYPLGVPLLLSTMLWMKRKEIEGRQTRDGDASLSSLSILFAIYKPKQWFASIVDIYRRLIISSLTLFMPSTMQVGAV